MFLIIGEEETIEVDPLDSSPNRDNKKEHSPKPADALLKDLQTTVSQAKHKIGDLQVEPKLGLDVTRKQNSSVCLLHVFLLTLSSLTLRFF